MFLTLNVRKNQWQLFPLINHPHIDNQPIAFPYRPRILQTWFLSCNQSRNLNNNAICEMNANHVFLFVIRFNNDDSNVFN